MREIKFRGKTKDGRWVEGVPIKNGFGKLAFICTAITDNLSFPMEQIYKFCVEVVPETVTQYTGLKDKDGTEVHEGDIDQAENGDKSVIVFLLKAGTYCVMPMDVYLNNDYQNESFFPDFIYGFGYDLFFDNCTPDKNLNIIGNIYENPELMEG